MEYGTMITDQQQQISGVFVVGPSTMAPAAVAQSTAVAVPTAIKKTVSVGTVRNSLSANQAGWWASDHRLETDKYAGAHYIAVRAIALQAAQATVSVYDDSTGGSVNVMKRSSLRRLFGSVAKSQAAANEPAAIPLPEDHRLVKLYKRPNPTQSGSLFRYEQVVQLSLTGSCLIVKIPNRLNQTVERYVVPTAIAQPRPPDQNMPRGGFYINPSAASAWATRMDAMGFVEQWGFNRLIGMAFPVESFIIIRWPHPILKSDGQSPVSAGALWTDTAEMLDRSRHSHLKNGPDPSIVITAPEDCDPTEDEMDRAAVKVNNKYGKPENHGKAFFVPNGTEITSLNTTPKDMAYMEAFTQLRDSILALHGVPPMAAGIVSPTGREGLYAPLLQFSLLTVQPMLSIMAEEETIQQSPEFGQGLTVEIEAMTVDDPNLLEQSLQTDIAAGSRTVNEFRAVRGLPPRADGDVLVQKGGTQQPSQLQPQGMGTDGSLPGMGSDATGQGGGGDGSSQLPAGGEFGDASRLQWKRNIKAIMDVIGGVKDGSFSPVMAVEMLQSLGLPSDRAQRLVDDATDGTVDEPDDVALLNGKSFRHNGHIHNRLNGNGHAKVRGSDNDWMTAAVKLLGGR